MRGEEFPANNFSKSFSQMIYKTMDNPKKGLALLCAGLKKYDSPPLINLDKRAWSAICALVDVLEAAHYKHTLHCLN